MNKQNEDHKVILSKHAQEVQELNKRISKVDEEHEKTHAEFKDLEREHEDLLVCLADQDLEIQALKERLRSHGEIILDEEDEIEDVL
jgi:chromosome segregation ATPase